MTDLLARSPAELSGRGEEEGEPTTCKARCRTGSPSNPFSTNDKMARSFMLTLFVDSPMLKGVLM